VASRRREDQIQPIDKYGTHLFYGAGTVLVEPPQRHYGTTPQAPYRSSAASVQTVAASGATNGSGNSAAASLHSTGWGQQDRIVFSQESREQDSRDFRSGAAPGRLVATAGRGENAQGPVYSDAMRSALDALLNGPSGVC
jgi:hypothetical protein